MDFQSKNRLGNLGSQGREEREGLTELKAEEDLSLYGKTAGQVGRGIGVLQVRGGRRIRPVCWPFGNRGGRDNGWPRLRAEPRRCGDDELSRRRRTGRRGPVPEQQEADPQGS